MASQKQLQISPGDDTQTLLTNGTIDVEGLVPWGSNYTFLATIHDDSRTTLAIYKPSRGERPLWDFPTGTLANREVAAYRVSQALGWPYIPPTILREGPEGIGMVQLFVEFVDGQHFFTLRAAHRDEMKRIAAFDAIINNTDRKGGHVLLGADDKIWCIDHGVTFHEHYKLRTVIWDFTRQRIPQQLIADMCALRERLARGDALFDSLCELISPRELRALRARLDDLIERGTFPEPPEDWPPVPWPPV
jgi:uncharacterized repeat protein (TIGR03843 family)